MADKQEEEFQCKAINDYYASVTDELDLKEGMLYTIMQTSPSGWWYAVNEEGEDGWVPSNYLERLDKKGNSGNASPQAQQQLQQQQQYAQNNEQKQGDDGYKKVNSDLGNSPDKPITEWNAKETLAYLNSAVNQQARNDFKLTQACRYITQLATEHDNCIEILESGGLDIIFAVMKVTASDVAIQMSCCAAVVVICANPNSKKYPAKTNGIFLVSDAIKKNITYRPFVVLAFNATCNFCHDHPQHRSMTLDTDVVSQVIAGMNEHRGKEEGFRVHSAGCLALRNIAADSKGQAAVGPAGVKAIVAGLEAYQDMREVAEGSMGVLCNLCALPANGEAFVMGGGIQLLDKLFSNPNSGDNMRLASASVLHNLAANPDTAILLSSDEGIDLLVKIIQHSEPESPLFLNTLKVLAALLFKLPEDNKPGGNKKPDVMKRIISKGLLATLNEAIQYQSAELQEMSVTLMVVITQTNSELSQQIANADCPAKLVSMAMHGTTVQALHCCMAIWFHVSDAFKNQDRLVENGIIEMLTNEWQKEQGTKEDTIRIGCGVIIKLLSNVKNAAAFIQYKEKINELVAWCRQNIKQLNDLCNAIEGQMKQLDPSSGTQMQIESNYQSVKNTNQPKQQPKQQEQKQSYQQPQKLTQNVQPSYAQSKGASPIASTHQEVDHSQAAQQPQSGNYHSYEDLKSGKVQVNGDKTTYLSDSDFQKVFGMSKQEFNSLKPWKQKNLKKAKGLF